MFSLHKASSICPRLADCLSGRPRCTVCDRYIRIKATSLLIWYRIHVDSTPSMVHMFSVYYLFYSTGHSVLSLFHGLCPSTVFVIYKFVTAHERRHSRKQYPVDRRSESVLVWQKQRGRSITLLLPTCTGTAQTGPSVVSR